MLDLDFTHEQDMLRDMVRGLCGEFSPLERVRALEDDPDGIARDLWQRFGDLGLCGLMVPESAGGSGMSLIDGVVLYEELGRSLAPLPHFVSCVLAAGAVIEAGTPTQQDEMLGLIASGEAIATVAWLEPGGGYKPRGVQLSARAAADSDGFVLDGSKAHVAFAAAADLLIVLARTGNGDADIDLFMVPADASGLSIEQRMSISSDTQYLVTFDRVAVSGTARLGASGSEAGTGWSAWQRTMHAGAILAAAQAVGGAAYALEITVEYAKTRRQFDKALARVPSHLLTTWPTPAPPSTAPGCWCARRPGPTAPDAPPSAWLPWPSCSPAAPTETSPPCASRCSAESASLWSTTSSSTSGEPSSSSSPGGTRPLARTGSLTPFLGTR